MTLFRLVGGLLILFTILNLAFIKYALLSKEGLENQFFVNLYVFNSRKI